MKRDVPPPMLGCGFWVGLWMLTTLVAAIIWKLLS